MKKQKINLGLFFSLILVALVFSAGTVLAAGSATVSWTPPTTDEGGGALTGLAGYKVFYKTSSNWLDILTTCLVTGNYGSGTEVDVPGGAVDHHHINSTLTPGQTYYFAVAAYDDAATPNVSKCATTVGALREISKRISYSGDIDGSAPCEVDNLDYTFFHNYYNGSNNTADISKDGVVDSLDYAYIHANYGDTPVTCDK